MTSAKASFFSDWMNESWTFCSQTTFSWVFDLSSWYRTWSEKRGIFSKAVQAKMTFLCYCSVTLLWSNQRWAFNQKCLWLLPLCSPTRTINQIARQLPRISQQTILRLISLPKEKKKTCLTACCLNWQKIHDLLTHWGAEAGMPALPIKAQDSVH